MQNFKAPKTFLRRTGRRRLYGISKRISRIAKRTIDRMAETKYTVNYGNQSVTASSIPLIQEITPVINVGNSKYTRIGQKVQYKWLTFNCAITATFDGVTDFLYSPIAYCRLVLFQGRNTPTPTPTKVLDSYAGTGDNVYAPLATINPTTVRVMNDEIFPIQPSVSRATSTLINNTPNGTPMAYTFKFRHRVKNNVSFPQGGTLPAEMDPVDRYWYMLMIYTDNGLVTQLGSLTALATWFSRISFIDI